MDFKFVKKPNLPQNKIKHCVVGDVESNTLEFLKSLQVVPLILKKSNKLDNEVAFHADMLFSYLGAGNALISPNQELFKNSLIGLGLRVEEAEFEPFKPYPNDILLNATLLGDYLICNEKHTSKKLLNFANENNMNIINSKQGYAKCSICVVNENAIITEDDGIASLLKNSQIDVLKVQPNQVNLSNKHFGFLGGASGKLSKGEILFNGNLKQHIDYNNIISFLNNYKINALFDESYNLTDIGGFLPVTELI